MIAWADNIIHCFGKAASMKSYMAWKDNVSIEEKVETNVAPMDVISFRVFLTDLHAMIHHWPEKFAKGFLNDLFFWVWQRMDTRATEMWTPAEAKTNSAPWQRTYNHEVNSAIRPEFRNKGEAYMYVVEDKICNILNSNYGITLANKTKRLKQKREYVSYVHNPAFYSITPTNDHYMLGEWVPFSLEKEGKQGSQINTDNTDPNRGSLPGSSDRIKKKPEREDEMSIDWRRIKDSAPPTQTPIITSISPMKKSDVETDTPTPNPDSVVGQSCILGKFS